MIALVLQTVLELAAVTTEACCAGAVIIEDLHFQ